MSGDAYNQLAEELIGEAEKWDGIQAGIASVDRVLAGPSYRAAAGVKWSDNHQEQTIQWLPNACSVLVLAMFHPEDTPELDWFDGGNTAGNRRLTEISQSLVAWLLRSHGIKAQTLPYHIERGGVFLKDAAVYSGLGVIGRNNLVLNPIWGPRLRLRAVLVSDRLLSSTPLQGFDPCHSCAMPCQQACLVSAFERGEYRRSACIQRLESDRANPIENLQTGSDDYLADLIKWCRSCELSCPAGVV